MKRLIQVVLAASMLGAVPLQAQGPRVMPAPPIPGVLGEIRGTVVDAESNTPISAASVAVWSKEEGRLVAGAIVSSDGTFRIQGLHPGSYKLRLTMLGYATQTSAELTLTVESPRANLGSIKLERAAIAITGVTASAERTVTIAPDRNSYRVKEVAPAATSASEVLENVPSVQVDADGKVSLRGNENVVVQINGRPSPMTGMQLANYLKQLPANTVERVEVVPNPSAKQDPEGMAGIINIVMKQGVDLGTSGGLNLTQSTAGRYSLGGNIGHQSGPLAYFLSYGFNREQRNELGVNNRTRLGENGDPLSYTLQDVAGDHFANGHNLSMNADYTFNKRDVLSTTLQLNRRSGDDGATIGFDELTGGRVSIDRYDRLRNENQTNWLGDAALSFKHTVTPQQREVSAELRFNHQDESDVTDLWRQTLTGATRSDLENDNINAQTNNVVAQLDVTRMLNKTLKLETGLKGTDRWLNRDYQVTKDVNGSGNWVVGDLSNALEFSENVNAAYAVLSKSGKKFDLQGGLRAEYAMRDFSLRQTAQSYPHNYASLFPSALINYKMNDKTQTKLSYSRRVRRPGTQELNPFPMFFDAQNVFVGNPRLNPEYTDAIELGYQRSGQLGTLQVSPFFRRTSNIIRFIVNPSDTIGGKEVTTINFQNLDHGSSWGTDVNGQFKLSKAVSGLAGFNVFKMVTDGGSTSSLSSDAVNWMARINGTINVRPTTALMFAYFYRGAMNGEKYRFAPQSMANISVRQKLMGDKATAIVRFADPFAQMKFKIDVTGNGMEQMTTRRFNSRAAYISLQYNFGKPPKLRQRKQDDQPQTGNPFGS